MKAMRRIHQEEVQGKTGRAIMWFVSIVLLVVFVVLVIGSLVSLYAFLSG